MGDVDRSVILDGRRNSKFNLIFQTILFLSKPSNKKKSLLQLVDSHLEVKSHISYGEKILTFPMVNVTLDRNGICCGHTLKIIGLV